jgi:hypothetical protein
MGNRKVFWFPARANDFPPIQDRRPSNFPFNSYWGRFLQAVKRLGHEPFISIYDRRATWAQGQLHITVLIGYLVQPFPWYWHKICEDRNNETFIFENSVTLGFEFQKEFYTYGTYQSNHDRKVHQGRWHIAPILQKEEYNPKKINGTGETGGWLWFTYEKTWMLGYTPPISAIIEEGVVTFLHIMQEPLIK